MRNESTPKIKTWTATEINNSIQEKLPNYDAEELDREFISKSDLMAILDDFDFEEIEDELDEQFPKGKCKERGNALVLFAKFKIKVEELRRRCGL